METNEKELETKGFWHRSISKKLGLKAAILLTAMLEIEKKTEYDKDKGFRISRKKLSDITFLSEGQQVRISSFLVNKGCIQIKKRDIPSVPYYKINMDKVAELMKE